MKNSFENMVVEEKVRAWLNRIAPLKNNYRYTIRYNFYSNYVSIRILDPMCQYCKLDIAMRDANELDPWINITKINVILSFLSEFNTAYMLKGFALENILNLEKIPDSAYNKYVYITLNNIIFLKNSHLNHVNKNGIFIHKSNLELAEEKLKFYNLHKTEFTHKDLYVSKQYYKNERLSRFTRFISEDCFQLYTLLKLKGI